MINERMEELAALHVLGVLTAEEQREMDAALRRDPELQALVTRLLAARDGMAGTVPQASPSPQLKQRIMGQLSPREKKATPPPGKKFAGGFLGFWLPWALTAAAVVLCANLTMQKGALRENWACRPREPTNSAGWPTRCGLKPTTCNRPWPR